MHLRYRRTGALMWVSTGFRSAAEKDRACGNHGRKGVGSGTREQRGVTLRRMGCALLMVCGTGLLCFGQALKFPADRPADIEHIRLALQVDLKQKRVDAQAAIDLTALRALRSLALDAVDFQVHGVRAAREGGTAVAVPYLNDGKTIEVRLDDAPAARGTRLRIEVDYTIVAPKAGLSFFAPTDAEPDIPYQVWSQGQAITNRYWVPCFDHPNEMQTTEMIVTAPAGNEVVSNGRLLSRQQNPDGTVTFHWLQDKPHVAYLMTLVVGAFHVEEDTWRGRPVTYYVPPARAGDARRTLGNTPKMLDLFSELTGVEYPWDKYASICAEQFGGGMENTSATTLGDGILHDERAALDYSADDLLAHELAHQWFGDLVTCADWAHIWINEGFASYFEAIWAEHHQGRDEYHYVMYNKARGAIGGGKEKPVVDRAYSHPDAVFDSRAYPKGAWIAHMLRARVGDEAFWRSIRQFLTLHAHRPVETHDLRRVFEQETGITLGRFFYDWTERPGAPALEVAFQWNAQDSLAEINVTQTQEADAFWFPLTVVFHREKAPPVTFVWEITEKSRRLYAPLPEPPVMVLVDPADAVLKEIKEKKGRDLWVRQLADGSTVVTRLRAAEYFAERKDERDIPLLRDALDKELHYGVAIAIVQAIGSIGGTPARDALLSALSTEHPKVRREVAERLGSFHADEQVAAALYTLIQRGDPSYRVEAAAIRAYARLQPDGATAFLASLLNRDSHREQIRSAALSGLGDQKDPAGLDTLLEWTQRGRPRACRQAAIGALTSLVRNAALGEVEQARIVAALNRPLDGEHRSTKSAVVSALGDLGAAARPALPMLAALEANDPGERIRNSAKNARERIQKGEPARVQLDDLRKTLDELKEENKRLREKTDRLEQLTTPPTPVPETAAPESAGEASSGDAGQKK